MHGTDREQRGDRSEIWRHAPITDHDDVRAAVHRGRNLDAHPRDSVAHPIPDFRDLEEHGNGCDLEALGVDRMDPRQLLVGKHRLLEPQPAGVPFVFDQQVLGAAEQGVEAHHRALENRVDRRVGHLGKQLLEIVEERARPVG